MLQAATDLGLVTEIKASNATAMVEEEDDFFILTEDVDVFQKPTHSKAEVESLHVLEDQRKDLPSLHQYPRIKTPFCKVQYHHSVFCSSRAFIFLCWTD